MRILFRCLLGICLACYLGEVNAQDINALLENYNNKVPQEKLYIQFDNHSYVPGQTIWYKAYLQNGRMPSTLSTNLYLDWYDAKGKLIMHMVAPVFDATASGSFTIPPGFGDKSLRLVSYTRWMLNFDSSFLFHRQFPIIQTTRHFTDEEKQTQVTTVGFYPEGGNMIANLPGILAFKAVNQAGMPVAISGSIVDQAKKAVASFSASHHGMGQMLFTPQAGETYTALWTDPQGISHQTVLPAVKTSGIRLTVTNRASACNIILERPATKQKRLEKITIVATMNQQVLFKGVANLGEKSRIEANIPIGRFPSGVACLTAFDADLLPVAERIIFVNNDEYRTEASLTADTLATGKRARNVYQLHIPDSINGTLSLSVTDGDDVFDPSVNILSQLLLSAELKGKIIDPAYYFSSGEDSVAGHLDLVMLTNGWRRFAWDDVFNDKSPVLRFSADTSYLSVQGNISELSEKKIKKAEVMNLLLVSKDSTKQFLFVPIQPDGSFHSNNMVLYDSTTVYFRMNNKTSIPWRSKTSINNDFLEPGASRIGTWHDELLPDTTGVAHILAMAEEQKKADSLKRSTTLQEVTVFAKTKTRIQELDERHTTGSFKNAGNSYNFNVLDDPAAQSFPDIFTYLQGRLPGVTIRINGPTSAVTLVRNERKSLTGGPAIVPVYINEAPVDNEIAKSLPVSSIAYVKLIPPPFVGEANGGAGGVLSIYTVAGDDVQDIIKRTPSMHIDKAVIVGYTPVKEFYSPNHAELVMNADEKDLRRTLLWQPNIQVHGKNNTIPVSFFNNDISHSFRILVEGMSGNGKLIYLDQKIGR